MIGLCYPAVWIHAFSGNSVNGEIVVPTAANGDEDAFRELVAAYRAVIGGSTPKEAVGTYQQLFAAFTKSHPQLDPGQWALQLQQAVGAGRS